MPRRRIRAMKAGMTRRRIMDTRRGSDDVPGKVPPAPVVADDTKRRGVDPTTRGQGKKIGLIRKALGLPGPGRGTPDSVRSKRPERDTGQKMTLQQRLDADAAGTTPWGQQPKKKRGSTDRRR